MNNLTKLSTIIAVLIAISGCVVIVADDSVAEGAISVVDGDDGGSSANDLIDDGFYFEVNGEQYQTLQGAVNSVSKTGEIKVLKDFDMNPSDIVEIPKAKIIILDMNGKTATASSDFSGRYIINNGILTITGDGTFEDAESADYRGPVTNNGILTIENGAFHGNIKNTFAHIWNSEGATATFNGGFYEGAVTMINGYIGSKTYINGGTYINSWYPAIDNSGHMEIRGGEFVNTSCSVCNEPRDNKEKPWGYTIRSGSHSSDAYLLIDEAEGSSISVTGVQGGVSIIDGSADINSGSFKTVFCMNEKHTGDQTSSYYALYVAPENDHEVKVTVNGGDFESAYRSAAKIGMDDEDSSSAKAITSILDGNFTSPSGVPTVSENAQAGGDVTISGGSFSSDVSNFAADGYVVVPGADGTYGAVETDTPEGVKITGDGQTVIYDTDSYVITIPSEGQHSGITFDLGFGDVGIVIVGDVKSNVTVSYDPSIEVDGANVAFNLHISGIDSDNMSVTVVIPVIVSSGHSIDEDSVYAYSIVDGEKVSEHAYASGDSIIIETNHNTPFYVSYEVKTNFVTTPDDDELPPFIPAQPDDDDSVTIVACAAAAVVAALMAVFLILTYRKD